jgi:hypothetical protein
MTVLDHPSAAPVHAVRRLRFTPGAWGRAAVLLLATFLTL